MLDYWYSDQKSILSLHLETNPFMQSTYFLIWLSHLLAAWKIYSRYKKMQSLTEVLPGGRHFPPRLFSPLSSFDDELVILARKWHIMTFKCSFIDSVSVFSFFPHSNPTPWWSWSCLTHDMISCCNFNSQNFTRLVHLIARAFSVSLPRHIVCHLFLNLSSW